LNVFGGIVGCLPFLITVTDFLIKITICKSFDYFFSKTCDPVLQKVGLERNKHDILVTATCKQCVVDHVILEESNVMVEWLALLLLLCVCVCVCVDGFHCNSEVMGRLSWQDSCGFPESFQPDSGIIS
jgi:hypothetical protein